MGWYGWRPYVPVAVKRARSLGKVEKLRKKGLHVQPVESCGREIASTFWGRGWCDHLEKFSDYANRLPRGRSYLRNGLVCHLEVAEGMIKAMVSGSDLYSVEIGVKKLPARKWADLRRQCAGRIGSLLELLQGRLSKSVMSVVTDRDKGLFPLPSEISLRCDCPDWAVMCKHVAAVLYGIGARLDEQPELLFRLRGVEHEELIGEGVGFAVSAGKSGGDGRRRIAEADLSEMFGIEIADEDSESVSTKSPRAEKRQSKNRRTMMTPAPKPRAQGQEAPRLSGRIPARPPALSVNRGRKARSEANVSGSGTVTGAAVARLRAKFKLSQGQFAQLLGVSVMTICNWERKGGALRLQERTRKAWSLVSKLGKREALGRLTGGPDRAS